MDKRRSTPPGWMDIKFCKTNLLIEHKELDGRFQFNGFARRGSELDRAEDRAEVKLKISPGSADLGEPECYYFEEYEAPRMNPSVVAAHKRIGLLQKFNKWQGKAMEKMQKSMDKMVSKIKAWRRKFLVLQARRRSPRPPHSLGVGHSSPLQGGSLPKSLTEPLLSSQGKEKTTRREGGRLPRPDAPARPPDSIESSSTTGLDRVQTEETQLDRADGRVDLEEPQFEIRDFEYDPSLTRTSPEMEPLYSRATKLHQGQGTHTFKMKKRRKRATSSIE
ncbi:unnamed protein product [Microthlaspi erraticum]|uniref:Arabidopsis retrotransposon Orf1 C-terminal domain-containing protein n=1 Tax=Microthlaspi erraticum TaxID=1685480 RepID=A0A6D2JR19_9BRAS|nr:unnamed protein product [Microthlaspi erraticum]